MCCQRNQCPESPTVLLLKSLNNPDHSRKHYRMFGFPFHPQMLQANKTDFKVRFPIWSVAGVHGAAQNPCPPSCPVVSCIVCHCSGRSAESRGLLNEGWRQYGLRDAASCLFTVGKQRCRCILLMRVNLSHILIWQKLAMLLCIPWRLLPCSWLAQKNWSMILGYGNDKAAGWNW